MAGAVDASSQVMSLKKNGVNCVMNIGTITSSAVTLVRELKKFGINIPVFNSWGAMLAEGLNEIGDAANQAYIVHAISPWYGEGLEVQKMRKVTLRYHPGTEKPYRGTSFSYGWAVGNILAEGFKKAGRNLDEDAMIDALESLKNYDTGGLLAPVAFSSGNHKGGNASKIYKADPVSGKYVTLTGWIKSE